MGMKNVGEECVLTCRIGVVERMAVWKHGDELDGAEGAFPLSTVVRVSLVLVGLMMAGGVIGTTGAQSVRLDTHVSTDSVRIGERFTVSLVAEHGDETDVAFPAADAGSVVFGDVEVFERGEVQDRAGTRQGDSVAYEVATFALDSVRVPAVPVQVVSGGDTTIASAPARTVTVASVVGGDAKRIHDVAPLAPFPRPLWTWLVLGLAGLGLAAGLAYLWWRRRRPTEAPPSHRRPETPQTPYEAATSWIRQLESYDLSDPDAVKPFYVELSNAVRVYLARELEVTALECTTREVAEALDHRPDVPEEAVARVRAVLELADLVKFADARPSADDHEKVLREARVALDTIEAAPRPRASGERNPKEGSTEGETSHPEDEQQRGIPRPEGLSGKAAAEDPDPSGGLNGRTDV